ncbi:ParB/RepB/Spo0J family partition protein [Aquimarina algiphila]|uniref:ParB/RepB/Spo0J family partition protein n=1 Tax=Aquimarina algiphila TaxID=2047982 RepID=A0A554VID7_9FLAO|nr:ParB/RepB/Spo0J family partition protein [Aquimarina algiphila]TSE07417.1 ParB/RepB/Spo0J family partition protein [Aquimarina algiphila]
METIKKKSTRKRTPKKAVNAKTSVTEGLQKVPLFSLAVSGNNPRKQFNEEEIAELAQSIKENGVLQNLVVTEYEKEDHYTIIAGERRFMALKHLVEQGEIDESYPVPVTVRLQQSDDDCLRLAVIENVQRKRMHPLDEAEAFFTLTRKGVDLETVSSQSGLSINTIKRRLLLHNLIDDAKAQYRGGSLKLSQAEAIGRANDDDQKDVLDRIHSGWEMDAEEINDYLIADKPNVAMAKFDLSKYTGTITTDLFGEDKDSFFDDVDQFERLQDEAVEALEAEYVFKSDVPWVEVIRGYNFERWRYDNAKEGEKGGAVILYQPDGEVDIIEGLIKKVEEKPVVSAEEPTAETTTTDKQEKRSLSAYTKTAYEYVANHKTVSLQNVLALNIRKAKEIDILQRLGLGREVSIGWHQANRFQSDDNKHKSVGVLGMEVLLTEIQTLLDMDWKTELYYHRDYAKIYARLKTLTDVELDKLLSILIAMSFGQETFQHEEPKDSLFNTIGRDLEVRVRDYWKPDNDFLNMHRKDQLLAMSLASGAAKGRYFDRLKKSELVSELNNYFTNEEPLTDVEQEFIKQNYCPVIMQFDE